MNVTSSVKLVSSSAALLLSSAAFFVSSPARALVAPGCVPGCAAGYHCEAEASQCPDVDCPPGTNCEPAGCVETVVYACVADPCMVDADCAANQVCVAQTSGCAGPALPSPICPPGVDCKALPAPPPNGDCEVVTTRSCKPRYELECQTSTDCGPGFTCEPNVSCGCSGSAPSSGGSADPAPSGAAAPLPPASGGSAGIMPAPDCSCTPSGTNSCRLTLQTCNFNSDCPAGLICKAASPAPIAMPADRPAGSGAAGSAGAGAEPPPDPMPVPELFCVPPNWDYPGGTGGSTGVGGGGTTGYPRPTPGGVGGSTGGTTSAGGTTGSAGGESEEPPTHPGSGGNGGNAGTDDNTRTEGGCQVGSGSSSSGYGVLAALGLAGLLRRRRRAS